MKHVSANSNSNKRNLIAKFEKNRDGVDNLYNKYSKTVFFSCMKTQYNILV